MLGACEYCSSFLRFTSRSAIPRRSVSSAARLLEHAAFQIAKNLLSDLAGRAVQLPARRGLVHAQHSPQSAGAAAHRDNRPPADSAFPHRVRRGLLRSLARGAKVRTPRFPAVVHAPARQFLRSTPLSASGASCGDGDRRGAGPEWCAASPSAIRVPDRRAADSGGHRRVP